jgi:hypothetical protein
MKQRRAKAVIVVSYPSTELFDGCVVIRRQTPGVMDGKTLGESQLNVNECPAKGYAENGKAKRRSADGRREVCIRLGDPRLPGPLIAA